MVAFKSIQSATADNPWLIFPANSTTLRVTGFDHMQGDSVYTWKKISGPGAVTFTPNGTSATASTAQFDGTAGEYLFEVTMSDSRGLTEVYETVTVVVLPEDWTDNDPPVPNPAGFASAPAPVSGMAISMTAVTGSDLSGPVEYLFTETSGNPGGTSSSWQTSPSYTDSGLSPSTQYTYTVTLRDAVGNTGSPSSAASATSANSSILWSSYSSDYSAYSSTHDGMGNTLDPGTVSISSNDSVLASDQGQSHLYIDSNYGVAEGQAETPYYKSLVGWAGWVNGGGPTLTFDLGASYYMATIDLWATFSQGPAAFYEVSASTDGTTFGTPITFATPADVASLDISSLGQATHVRLKCEAGGLWTWLGQVEFNGTAVTGPDTIVPDPNAERDESWMLSGFLLSGLFDEDY